MRNSVSKINISEARSKLTQLDKLLKPGEALQINKRDKAYARIELLGEMDGYDRVLNAIESLPETKGKLRAVAQNYKSKVIGSRFGGSTFKGYNQWILLPMLIKIWNTRRNV